MLRAEGVSKFFKESQVKALQSVSLTLAPSETLGVVGESGSGKSTLARVILGLVRPDEGQVFFEGKPLYGAPSGVWKKFREKVQIIFQDPFSSLDPRMRVEDLLEEPLLIHRLGTPKERKNKIAASLEAVELGMRFSERLPRQLSGGECQRVAIARALCLSPSVLICDEATSSLDAISQAQILNLFLKLQKEKKVSYLFISHHLRVVRHMSDRVLVLKNGLVCEENDSQSLFKSPRHAYTQSLIQTTFSV